MSIRLWLGLAVLSWYAMTGVVPCQAADDSILGTSTTSEAALIGILYDLKQTDSGKPAISNTNDYDKTIASFIAKGWDESVLNSFYRVAHPFYTTQIFIPMLADKAAPKAFGVENRIKDGYWIIHYKGQVIPPADGRYRFGGYAHATLLVAVNGQLVLNGCAWDPKRADSNFPRYFLGGQGNSQDPGGPAGDHRINFGPWIDLKHSQPIDLDILVGNRQATELCAFLLVQKADEADPVDPATQLPIPPVFQVAQYDGPPFPQGKGSTRAQFNILLWKCFQ